MMDFPIYTIHVYFNKYLCSNNILKGYVIYCLITSKLYPDININICVS